MCISKLLKKKEPKVISSDIPHEPFRAVLEPINENRNILAMDNDFSRLPRLKATLRTNKLICLILSYIDFAQDNRNSNGDIWVSIENKTINSFIQKNGVKNKNHDFYNIAREIVENSIISGKINGQKVVGSIISTVVEEEKSFAFKINGDFIPYIQQLQSRFTLLQLDTIKQFRSNYAFMMYQELKSWSLADLKENGRFYTMRRLYEIFELDQDEYRLKSGKYDLYNFEKKVMTRAQEEINEINEIRLDLRRLEHEKYGLGYFIRFVDYSKCTD